jgi:hypothetical protein
MHPVLFSIYLNLPPGVQIQYLGKEGAPQHFTKYFMVNVFQIPKFHGQYLRFFTNKRGL